MTKDIVKSAAIPALLLSVALHIFGVGENTYIRVRLIDAHSGRPYRGRHVELTGTNASPGGLLHRYEISFDLQTRTGPDGVAQFRITTLLPYRLLFYRAQANRCGPQGFNSFVTAEVMQSGVVVPNTCAGKGQKFEWREVTATPGEIVIFAVEPPRPLPILEIEFLRCLRHRLIGRHATPGWGL